MTDKGVQRQKQSTFSFRIMYPLTCVVEDEVPYMDAFWMYTVAELCGSTVLDP